MDERHDVKGDWDREPCEWVDRYRSSGLSLRDFAQRHRLGAGRLHYWVYGKRQRGRANGQGMRFQEVRLEPLLAGLNWIAEVDLPGAVRLRVSGAASPAWVVEVVQALRGAC